MAQANSQPLVSVVIPCYNHGHFLDDAILSILNQTYENLEIIVIDDGSTDNTTAIANSYHEIRLYRQENSGLSAARNYGLKNSSGKYVVFLDADDILLSNAIEINVGYINLNPEFAFVSGSYRLIAADKTLLPDPTITKIQGNHYHAMLRGNYIGMHAAVLYNKEILENAGGFDSFFSACEDYDIYLRLTSENPVMSHQTRLALYRMHGKNMSRNSLKMLKFALHALKKQEQNVISSQGAIEAYDEGIQQWTMFYLSRYFGNNFRLGPRNELEIIKEIKVINPKVFSIYLNLKMKSVIKKTIPRYIKRKLYERGLIKYNNPSIGHVNLGDLKRTVPFSRYFGYDRGGPIDRYYIESFLQENSVLVKGNVLEIGDNDYTLKYGGDRILKSDVLHIQKENPKATIIGDLSKGENIPSNAFDCFIFTQTLHLIYDFKAALKTCYRILKPGGVLLLTVPGISQKDSGEWEANWLWAFTSRSMQLLFEETFSGEDVQIEIKTYGNVLTSAAFLYGLGVDELTTEELETKDDYYQQVISVKAIKPVLKSNDSLS